MNKTLFVVAPCKHGQGLCKNWTGHDINKDEHEMAGECQEKAEGCPYLVTPKQTQGYLYKENDVRS